LPDASSSTNLYRTLFVIQTLHSPLELRIMGLVFTFMPVESEKVAWGVLVPAANENNCPPTSGCPLFEKNWLVSQGTNTSAVIVV
jgi:hypothetical protein